MNERVIIETREETDAEGNTTSSRVEKNIMQRNPEPDYIKLYTQTWCEFNQIPVACRPLFLELAMRMTYANSSDSDGGQLVYTGKPISDTIQGKLKIKKARYLNLIAQLVDCGALRKVNRGVYQVNPSYAGKGEWHYNPTKEQGGIENIIAKFDFADKTVDTKIIWADDRKEENESFNRPYRQGLGVSKENEASITETTVVNKGDVGIPGQMAITDTDMHTGTED